MMHFTRRQLFTELLNGITDYVSSSIPKFKPSVKEEWIEVGSLGDFVPGTKTSVNKKQQIIVATNYGLKAIDVNAAVVRPIRMDQGGKIYINIVSKWPDASQLCIMTGKRITEIGEEM